MDLLVRAGFTVTSDDEGRVVLASHDGASLAFRLVVRKRAPRPSSVTPPKAENSLFYAPQISPAVGEALANAGWSWLSDDACDLRSGEWEYRSPGISEADPAAPPLLSKRRGRPASATWAVARSLAMSSVPLRQRELAEFAGSTQGRVSQVLKELAGVGLVERGARGWFSQERRRLIAWFLDEYPGAGGVESWWFHLDPLAAQVEAVTDAYPAVVVSGDSAADEFAPWRSPTHAVVYSPTLLDLRGLGFVPAQGPGDGSILVVSVPVDASVLRGGPIADGLQVAFDLRRLGGSDRAEAAQRVLDVLVES